MSVKQHLETIHSRITHSCQTVNRHPDEVKIIGVTKYVDVERAREAIHAGVRHLGENRLEGLLEKYEALQDEVVSWHFIGTLQSKKVKHIIPYIDYLHSLDRLSLAKEIEKRAEQPVKCFVQVNVAGESSKHGVALDKLHDFLHELQRFEKINVVGLMTMAPHIDDDAHLREIFKKLKSEQVNIQKRYGWSCDQLSMGMSNDYPIAVEEGATFVRIGSSLVGKKT